MFLSASVVLRCAAARTGDPTLQQIHIQRFSKMARQAIDARFAFCDELRANCRGREVDSGARGLDKPTTTGIVVEQTVHVSAEHPPRVADGAVSNRFLCPVKND
jgi:hypothetical protein